VEECAPQRHKGKRREEKEKMKEKNIDMVFFFFSSLCAFVGAFLLFLVRGGNSGADTVFAFRG
jgi:heme/copper-type cytochrome/quinol oxidase subunit 3